MAIYREQTGHLTDFPGRIKFQQGDMLEFINGKHFRVTSILGEGGFGTVYKINNLDNQKSFALKLLEYFRMKPSEIKQISKRFYEGYKAGLILSDYLVKNHSSGFFDGNPFVIMDYCPNGNLSKNKIHYRSEYEVLQLASQLCAGLNDLHRNGFVHRDFKPENILFDQYNIAKLCDFDISGRFGLQDTRLTTMNDSGEVVEVYGTLAYSAPEQMDPKGAYKYLGPQMDLFSLGVTLYEVLSGGNLPFGTYQEIKDTPLKYTKRIKTKKYQPISEWRYDLSSKWRYFFEKTLEPDPSKRPNKIHEVLELLDIDMPNNKFHSINTYEPNTLIIRSGENIGAQFSLEKLFQNAGKNIIRIGRKDLGNNFNEINLDETHSAYISRKHATIEKLENRHYIRDGQWNTELSKAIWTFSLNGTYVNNTKLFPNETRLLESEDIITLGNVILQYFR